MSPVRIAFLFFYLLLNRAIFLLIDPSSKPFVLFRCDFFNYARNTVCLRCDCKRPGEVSASPPNTGFGGGYQNGSNSDKADIDSRLAANEEKAQRWFSKISQLDSTSDISTIADDDFPEIMPLRKGVNRFVVSTRKTPLERRMANSQYQTNLGNDVSSKGYYSIFFPLFFPSCLDIVTF